MVRAIKILILCLLTVSGFSQVVQERNARGADRIIILKDGFRVPIRDTATAPTLLNYSGDSSRGGVVYDSTLQKLCFWTGVRWVCLDDSATGSSIDTTSLSNRINLKLNISDTATMNANFLVGIGAGTNVTVDNTNPRFPVVSASGGGGGLTIDSVAIRRIGVHYVGFNSGFGSGGNNGGSSVTESNFFIGNLAGNAITSGASNVGIGVRALNSLTTATGNVAIGLDALRSMTGASVGPNIAIGSEALSNYTGNGNTLAIGRRALFTMTTATGGLAIGNRAGEEATGADITYIGNSAGDGNTSGTRNTSVGFQSANSGYTTGGSNVSIGYRATADGAGVSSFVTHIGTFAGFNTNDDNTVYLGYQAGGGNTSNRHTGDYNIAIGENAMYDVGGVRTGASNIVIGDRINLPSRTSSNQIVIGSNSVNWLTRFTGGGWLFNNTGSAVTTQTTSAALEINGTNGAVLLPRLTTAQRDALTATDGMQIYNTTTNKFQGRAGGAWVDLH
jgi:hypothetical protein